MLFLCLNQHYIDHRCHSALVSFYFLDCHSQHMVLLQVIIYHEILGIFQIAVHVDDGFYIHCHTYHSHSHYFLALSTIAMKFDYDGRQTAYR